jgi:aryl-alcohol dehydrogenase-like predicted oxidoreductase
VSNVSEEELKAAQKLTPVVSVQNRYNVSDRSSEAVLNLCEVEEIAFLPWAPIQQTDNNVGLRVAAERHGVSPQQIVVAWLLAKSPVMLPIPGTGSPEHAEDNVAAAAIELSQQEVDAISQGG